jgi:hypothetical protein
LNSLPSVMPESLQTFKYNYNNLTNETITTLLRRKLTMLNNEKINLRYNPENDDLYELYQKYIF